MDKVKTNAWPTSALFLLRSLTRKIAKYIHNKKALYLLRKILPKPTTTVSVHDFDGDLSISLSLNEHMQSQIFWYGKYNHDIADILDQILQEGMCVIDAGANIGEVSLLAANRVGKTGRVLSIEPVDDIADRLETNINLNGFENIKVLRTAVGEQRGNLPIYRPSSIGRDQTINEGIGSLYKGDTSKQREQAGLVTVERLDDIAINNHVSRVDLIKIDIEGAELPALRGAEQILKAYKPLLIIEILEDTAQSAGYSRRDIIDYLADLGYSFKAILTKGRTRSISSELNPAITDILCIPSSGNDGKYT